MLRSWNDGAAVAYLAEPDYFNDGPTKPLRIWSRIGRRPVLAAGNSNGDIWATVFDDATASTQEEGS